jgi:hypothetical protein
MMLLLAIFGGLFLLVGIGTTIGLTVRPMWLAHASQSWTEARCRIDRSEVESYVDSDNQDMYRARVEYTYDVGGRQLRGDRIDFGAEGSSSMRSSHADTVARYPAGAEIACWYDPAEPASVVLNRTIEAGLFLAFPIPFAAIGFFLLRYASARRRDLMPAVAGRSDRRLHLRRGSGALEVAGAVALAALFVTAAVLANGVATTLVSSVALAVAAAAVLVAGHELRCYLSALTVTLPERVRRGEELRAAWGVQSPIGAPHGTACLIATETRSTGSSVQSSTVRTIPLHDPEHRGAATVRIPDDAPTSVADPRYKLDWFVEIRAHLPLGPDVRVRAPITVEA